MKKLRELRQKLAALVTEERAQLDRLKKEERSFDATETEAYEKRAKDIGDLDEEIKKLELVEQRDADNRERDERLSKLIGTGERKGGTDDGTTDAAAVEMKAIRTFLRGGMRALDGAEFRALSVGSDVEGGYLKTPMQVVREILKNVDDQTVIRQISRKFPVGDAEGLGVPTLDTDVDDATWTSELATGSEDTALRFGRRELRPHPLAKRIKVSRKLVRSSVIDIVAFIQERFGYKFGLTEEKAFLTGDGVQKPLGLFIASNDGIPTSRDVSTENTTTSVSADGLINAKFSLKAAYWNSARWIFHRDALKQIRKLKTGDGQYIWTMGLADGLGARIVDSPYSLCENVPNTFTTGLYVGIIGDFNYYWIADSMNMQIQVLNELYAETNQVGYIARAEVDAMPVLAEAFARVKLA